MAVLADIPLLSVGEGEGKAEFFISIHLPGDSQKFQSFMAPQVCGQLQHFGTGPAKQTCTYHLL